MSEIVKHNDFKPCELLNIFKNFLTNKEINATVISLHGIYYKSDRVYGQIAYDKIKDEDNADELTIVIPLSMRDDLKNGNLLTVYGTLDRRVQTNGSIQILLNVSRIDKVKELAISEDEVKRAEYRRIKGERGYKNVDSILEAKLFTDKRPTVALLYAESSITNADFEKGLQAAKTHIDFLEHRVNFSNSAALSTTLKKLDAGGLDVIAVVRGGGSGIEKLDDLAVVETLTNLNTAWIYAVGHEKENLFIRNIADKVVPIPFALGTYFRDLVENVIAKRNQSRAALIEEVKKQYQKQIEDSNKKNQELTKQLEQIQKQTKEQQEASNKKIEALTKANTDAQKTMKEQNEAAQKLVKEQTEKLVKANEEAKKVNSQLQEQLSKQGKALTEMQSQQKKQQEDFNKSLEKMQNTNKELQTSLNKLNTQNTQAAKDLADAKLKAAELEAQLKEAKKGCAMPGCLGIVVLVILAVVTSCCVL